MHANITTLLAISLALTSFHSVHADETLSAQVGSALHKKINKAWGVK